MNEFILFVAWLVFMTGFLMGPYMYRKGHKDGYRKGLDDSCNVSFIDKDGRMRVYSEKEEV